MKNLRIDLISTPALTLAALCLTAGCGTGVTLELPPETAEPETALLSPTFCLPEAASASAGVAWVQDGVLRVRDRQGQPRELHRFEITDPTDTPPSVSLVSHGGHFVALASWYRPSSRWELVGFDPRGRLAFSASGDGSTAGQPFLGEDGSVAANLWVDEAPLLLTVDAAGLARRTPGLRALGKPIAGVVPVQEERSSGTVWGWLDLERGTTSHLSPTLASWPTYAPGRFLQVVTTPKPGLVVHSPGASLTLPLTASPEWLAQATLTARGETALLSRTDWQTELEVLRIDLRTGETRAHPLPEGKQAFGYHIYFGASLDDAGNLLLPLRDARVGGLHRARPGEAFEPLGQQRSEITTLEFIEASGTYLVWSLDYLGYFPTEPWETGASPEQLGPSLQVIRPEEGIVHTLPLPGELYGPNGRLSEDGLCGVLVDPEATLEGPPRTRLRWLDVRSGELREELLEGQLAGPVWLR